MIDIDSDSDYDKSKQLQSAVWCVQALTILAVNLNMPPEVVPLSKSFFQLGGNSISMVMSIVQLRQHSLHVSIERFSRSASIRDLVDHVTEFPPPRDVVGDVIGRGSYAAVPLASRTADGHRTVDMLAEGFAASEPLDVLLGITAEQIRPFARSLHRAAIKVSNMACINLTMSKYHHHHHHHHFS